MIITGQQGPALVRISASTLFLASALNRTTTGWLTKTEPLTKNLQQNLDKAERRIEPRRRAA